MSSRAPTIMAEESPNGALRMPRISFANTTGKPAHKQHIGVLMTWGGCTLLLLLVASIFATLLGGCQKPKTPRWVHAGQAPNMMVMDDKGLIFAADAAAGVIFVCCPELPPTPFVEGLKSIGGMVFLGKTLYVADTRDGTVLSITPDRKKEVVLSGLHEPSGLAVDRRGDLLVAETGADRIRRWTPTTGANSVYMQASAPGSLTWTQAGLFIATNEGVLLVDDYRSRRVLDSSFGPLRLSPAGKTAVFAFNDGGAWILDGNGGVQGIRLQSATPSALLRDRDGGLIALAPARMLD